MTLFFILLGPAPREVYDHDCKVCTCSSFRELLRGIFLLGHGNQNASDAWVVMLQPRRAAAAAGLRISSPGTLALPLEKLSLEEKIFIVRHIFLQLNMVVVGRVPSISRLLSSLHGQTQVSRILHWIGASNESAIVEDNQSTTLDFDAPWSTSHDHLYAHRSMMRHVFSSTCQTLPGSLNLGRLMHTALDTVCDVSLLVDSDVEKSRLCYLVGLWGFPAHEIPNGELAFCAFTMLRFAAEQARHCESKSGESQSSSDLHACSSNIPSDQDLLSLVVLLWNAYIPSNPFHNFRHAVDVVHACFHFLVRLGCLPSFQQWRGDEGTIPGEIPHDQHGDIGLTYLPQDTMLLELVPLVSDPVAGTAPLLNPMQTFAVLVAALGHDIGHPGVTNAFMVSHNVPAARLFNYQLVLELFHLLVFVNDILRICWPRLLGTSTGLAADAGPLPVLDIIIHSILATDMAEHFEYVLKLTFALQNHKKMLPPPGAQLVLALLLKCADISNVSRPLRILSQWAVALLREFEMMEILEDQLGPKGDVAREMSTLVPPIPISMDEILASHPDLHKGQLFFIDTFASGLFSGIGQMLPELKFASENIRRNRLYWHLRSREA